MSPISDAEDSRKPTRSQQTPTGGDEKLLTAKTARGRLISATPSSVQERSQSLASQKSETPSAPPERPSTRRTQAQAIKDEVPSTPASDTDQRTTRRGRPRTNTATAPPATAQKRKRSPPPLAGSSATPPLPSPAGSALTLKQGSTHHRAAHSHPLYNHSADLVLVSKNFAKTSALILNEITSHKLAGIFAKPLSERDAPGYRTLVRRPQDLKSIRTAVGKGSKAAIAAVEALESANEADEDGASVAATPTKETTPDETKPDLSKEGPLGETGMYLVKVTDELVPPRGIVNSSQLEMELTRMFANAVMFNPLAGEERGFGRRLKPRKLGGDLRKQKVKREEEEEEEVENSENENESSEDAEEESGNEDEDAEEEKSENENENTDSETSTSTSDSSDPGGIISDAREMFTDVMDMIRRWRDVEIERIVGAAPTLALSGSSAGMEGRHASLTSLPEGDVTGEDGAMVVGMSTPSHAQAAGAVGEEGIGTTRKRRRLNE